jgi:hypothetical protein
MAKLILPRHPTAGAGAAVTFQGDAPNQGVYWEVVSVDPDTGAEGLAHGSLKWQRTRTNGAGQSVNYYFALASSGHTERIRTRAV